MGDLAATISGGSESKAVVCDITSDAPPPAESRRRGSNGSEGGDAVSSSGETADQLAKLDALDNRTSGETGSRGQQWTS